MINANLNNLSMEEFNVTTFRKGFPILNQTPPVLYFDNAATSLKPNVVVNAVNRFYLQHTANIHRGAHSFSEISSELFEDARQIIAKYFNVKQKEIIFTYGVTHAANLLAAALRLDKSDVVITNIAEHHSNILPWSCSDLYFADVDESGVVKLDEFEKLLSEMKPTLVCIQQVSNVTGVIQPLDKICELTHKYGGLLLVDAAQGAPHLLPGPFELNCDFYILSGHKMLGPSGTGVLYGRANLLEQLHVPATGGGMVNHVSKLNYELRTLPWRFEAGTPNIEGVIGLAEAFKLLAGCKKSAADYLDELGEYMESKLSKIKGLVPIGLKENKRIKTIFTFHFADNVVDIDQFAKMLSTGSNIMVRSGSLCAHQLFDSIQVDGGIRISAYLYNTKSEIDELVSALSKLLTFFQLDK